MSYRLLVENQQNGRVIDVEIDSFAVIYPVQADSEKIEFMYGGMNRYEAVGQLLRASDSLRASAVKTNEASNLETGG